MASTPTRRQDGRGSYLMGLGTPGSERSLRKTCPMRGSLPSRTLLPFTATRHIHPLKNAPGNCCERLSKIAAILEGSGCAQRGRSVLSFSWDIVSVVLLSKRLFLSPTNMSRIGRFMRPRKASENDRITRTSSPQSVGCSSSALLIKAPLSPVGLR